LKGEASLTGFVEVSRLVHLIEGFVKLVCDRHGRPDQHAGDLILRGLDLITELVQGEPGAWPCEAAAFASEVQALLSQTEIGENAVPIRRHQPLRRWRPPAQPCAARGPGSRRFGEDRSAARRGLGHVAVACALPPTRA